MAIRPQPYRLKWPLTPTQVEGVDEMLQILFKKVRQLEGAGDESAVDTFVTPAFPALPGLSSDGGDSGFDSYHVSVPGAIGVTGETGARGVPGVDGEDGDSYWTPAVPSNIAPVIQTTTSTGTQNDFVLLGNVSELRCNNATLLTLTGLTAGTDGQRLLLVSVGAGQVDIPNASGSSAAGNKIANGITGTRSLAAGSGSMQVVYNKTTAVWVVVSHTQGARITAAYAAGNFTASGAMTWTVDSGDQSVDYHLSGSLLTVFFTIVTSTVGGVVANSLLILIPGGHTPAIFSLNAGTYIVPVAGVAEAGYTLVVAADTHIYVQRLTNTAWVLGTNVVDVEGTIIFPVV